MPRRAVRVGRAGIRVLGGLLVVVSAAAFVPAVWLAVLWLIDVLPPGVDGGAFRGLPVEVRRHLLPIWLASVVVSFGGRSGGLWLLRRDRRLVIFLRRFGYEPAGDVVTAAVRRAGRSWRVVTFDDSRITSIGVSTKAKKTLSVVDVVFEALNVALEIGKFWVPLIAKVAGVGLALSGLAVFLVSDGDTSQRFDSVVGLVGWGSYGSGPAAAVFKVFVYALTVCLLLWVLTIPLAGLLFLLTPILALFGSFEARLRLAEQDVTVQIRDVSGIGQALRRLRKATRRVFSARLMVLKVDDQVWRPTVTDVAGHAAITLIDVSEPTESLLWEIETLAHIQGRTCVFVGEHARVNALLGLLGNHRLRTLLDGRSVLAYTSDTAGIKRFTKALRATFEQVTEQTPAEARVAVGVSIKTTPGSPGQDSPSGPRDLNSPSPQRGTPLSTDDLRWPEHCTPALRKAVARAQDHASRRRDTQLRSDDLWLGLLDEPASTATTVLNRLGIQAAQLRQELAHREIETQTDSPAMKVSTVSTPAKIVVQLALDEAVTHAHTQISTGHMLIALLRGGEQTATELGRGGVTVDLARRYTALALAASRPGAAPAVWRQWHRRATKAGTFLQREKRGVAQIMLSIGAFIALLVAIPAENAACTTVYASYPISAAIGAVTAACLYLLGRRPRYSPAEAMQAAGIGMLAALLIGVLFDHDVTLLASVRSCAGLP